MTCCSTFIVAQWPFRSNVSRSSSVLNWIHIFFVIHRLALLRNISTTEKFWRTLDDTPWNLRKFYQINQSVHVTDLTRILQFLFGFHCLHKTADISCGPSEKVNVRVFDIIMYTVLIGNTKNLRIRSTIWSACDFERPPPAILVSHSKNVCAKIVSSGKIGIFFVLLGGQTFFSTTASILEGNSFISGFLSK